MSVRHYTPRRTYRKGISFQANLAFILILSIALLLQIAYPLLDGEALRVVTIATVYWGAGAMALHSLLAFGSVFTASYLAITLLFGFFIELLGRNSGWPFGEYVYDPSLGPQFINVPIVVPFAWAMMAYPALVAARRITKRWVFLYGGLLMAGWDLFLDPQMVSAGRWSWKDTQTHLPFSPDIPLSNAFGWLLSGIALIALLHLLLPKDKRKKPASFLGMDIFLAWSWLGGVIGNLFFFQAPSLAIGAGLIYGAILAPYFFSRWIGRP